MSRPLLIISERRLLRMNLGDALCSRLFNRFESGEGSNELLDSGPSLNATELPLRLDDRRADPAHDHRAALPALYVLRVRCDPAVQILDRVRRAQFHVQTPIDTKLEGLRGQPPGRGGIADGLDELNQAPLAHEEWRY